MSTRWGGNESRPPRFDVVKLSNEKKKLAKFNKDTIVRKGNVKMLKDKYGRSKKMTWSTHPFVQKYN